MAIPQMGVGDTIEIATPADLAYGPAGGPIPGGATLLFTVKLLAIEQQTDHRARHLCLAGKAW